MKKYFNFLILLSSMLLFVACGDDVVTNISDEAKETGDISFLVLDRSGNAIDSVNVYCVSDGKTRVTDKSGYSVWEKTEIGTQFFILSKEGYAPMRISVNMKDQGQGSVARVPDITQKVVMLKQGATIQGTMMYRDRSTNNLVAAPNISVVLSFENANFTVNEITVETDKNGEYIFEDLPEGTVVTISVPQAMIDGHLYVLSTDLEANIDRVNDVQNLEIAELTLVIKNVSLINTNLTEIETSTALSLVFSADLDKDSVFSKWTVSTSSGDIVLTTSSLKESKEISIEAVSGKWEEGETYTVTGRAYTIEGSSVSVTQKFTVGETATSVPGQVKNLEVVNDSPYVQMTWDAPDGNVTRYDIYYKTNSMNNYLYFMKTTDTTISVLESDLVDLYSDTSVMIIVLPYNEYGYADINEAEPVKYKFD